MGFKSEEELLQTFGELEKAALKKGDALADAPHDGGFATEGENIQSKAGVKKAVAKAVEDGTLSKAQAAKLLKMMSASDAGDEDEEGGDEDEDTESMKSKKKSVSKSDVAARRLAAASGELDEDAGSDLRKALVDEVPEAEKMMDASDFVKGLVDVTAKSVSGFKATVEELAKSLSEGQAYQRDYNTRLAKGLVQVAKALSDVDQKLEKLLNAPVAPQARQLTVAKSDVLQPQFGGVSSQEAKEQSTFDFANSPLNNVPLLRIQEALVAKAEQRQLDPMAITNFELTKDFRALPEKVLKALEAELC